MSTIDLLPTAPDPYDPDFNNLAHNFTIAISASVPQFNQVFSEVNEIANNALFGTSSLSTSPITIAVSGAVNLTVDVNKSYLPGMVLKVASAANPTDFIKILVTSYNMSTGAMVGSIISSGGSGTFSNWAVFFDLKDTTSLSVPLGEVVASGNLLAIDDSGNSLAVDSITTGVLQAVTATSLQACHLSNGNTAIFYVVGTDLRMTVADNAGATITAPITLSTVTANTAIAAAQLTNGNIALMYRANSGRAQIKIVSITGTTVMAETQVNLYSTSEVALCALTGGGFAFSYADASQIWYEVRANDGSVVKAPTGTTGGAVPQLICPTPSGGFITMPRSNTQHCVVFNSVGTQIFANPMMAVPSGSYRIGAVCKSGVIALSSYNVDGSLVFPTIKLASDTINAGINSPYGTGNGSNLCIPFDDAQSVYTELKNSSLTILGDGNFLVIYSTSGGASYEYPRYAVFNDAGQIIRSGILFGESTYASTAAPVIAIPKGSNGFSLVWLATNQNIKFAQVKSGKVVGISDGQEGTKTKYNVNGAVTLVSGNMLNVGGAKINYSRQGTKVVI